MCPVLGSLTAAAVVERNPTMLSKIKYELLLFDIVLIRHSGEGRLGFIDQK